MSEQTQEIRPEVERFAEFMEEVLRRNDYKGGWKEEPVDWLIKRIVDEALELYRGYYEPQSTMFGWRYNSKEHLKQECADIANFAMMVFDVLDSEPDNRPWESGAPPDSRHPES